MSSETTPAIDTLRLVEERASQTPKTEIDARIARLQARLRERGIDAAIITQNADLFYFSGTVQQSHLFVPAIGEPVLFVRKTVERARLESPLARQVALPSLRQLGDLVRERLAGGGRGDADGGFGGGEPSGEEGASSPPTIDGSPPPTIGLELDVLPVANYRRYQSQFPGAEFVDIGADIVRLRALKSAHEIDRIRASAAVAVELWRRIPGILREGLTEAAFAGLVEAEARALGHQGVIRMRAFNGEMFYGQLLTGASGAVPSFLDTPLAGTGLSPAVAQGVSFKPIVRGEPVVFDFVPVIDGYVSDFTRIFVLGGLSDERLVAAYECARRAQDEVMRVARPGATCRSVYEAALAVAGQAGLAAHFMGHGPAQVRFIGHGVGLELDELPVLSPNDLVLEEGMVFACEPKFVFPGLGAIGIENTWLVAADGIECLTAAPEEITVV